MDQKNQPNIYRMLLPSVLGILLCAVCLVGSSFAWFSSNKTAMTQSVQSASYGVSVSAVDAQGISAGFDGQSYVLAPGSYTVTLTAGGTATNGYCVVTLGSEKLYTQQFAQSSIAFTVNVNTETAMLVEPCWGTSIYHESPNISDGTVIGELSAPVCTCQTPCNPAAADSACAVCAADSAACAAQSVCVCETACVEGAGNQACPVCAADPVGCLGMAQPGETQPGETQPEVTQPEATQPEATQPEQTQPEQTQPEETQPGATQPEETQPEATEAPVASED